jgi:hypothetical protein
VLQPAPLLVFALDVGAVLQQRLKDLIPRDSERKKGCDFSSISWKGSTEGGGAGCILAVTCQRPCAAASDVRDTPSAVAVLGSQPAARSASTHSVWPAGARHTSHVTRHTSHVTRHAQATCCGSEFQNRHATMGGSNICFGIEQCTDNRQLWTGENTHTNTHTNEHTLPLLT